MKTALIIHGTCDEDEFYSDKYPSLSNSHWSPWLQKQMLMAGYLTQTPEMPVATYPDYTLWKEAFERHPVNENSILIGHSCGGGFLLRYLSENKIKTKRTILVAPWLDPEKEKDPGFFDFKIDQELVARTDLHMLYSDDDMKSIQMSVDIIKSKIPAIQFREYRGYGHFCFEEMGTQEFPELRDLVLKG